MKSPNFLKSFAILCIAIISLFNINDLYAQHNDIIDLCPMAQGKNDCSTSPDIQIPVNFDGIGNDTLVIIENISGKRLLNPTVSDKQYKFCASNWDMCSSTSSDDGEFHIRFESPAGTPIGVSKLSFEIMDNSPASVTVTYYQGATGNAITGTGISGGRKYVCQNNCIPIDSVVIISSYESGISNESQLFVLDSLLFYYIQPTITLGSNPEVCSGTTSASLTYSDITNSPNQYSINFNSTAEAQGFTDVTLAALPSSPISITVPAGANAGTYNASLTVTNSSSGCTSQAYPITVTIHDNNTPTGISLSNNTVNENEPTGTLIGVLTTTDADAGDTHTYSLVSGAGDDDNSSFIISNDTLKTNEVFNYEVKSSYSIRIQTDDGNGGTYEEAFTISVNDIAEEATGDIIDMSSSTQSKDDCLTTSDIEIPVSFDGSLSDTIVIIDNITGKRLFNAFVADKKYQFCAANNYMCGTGATNDGEFHIRFESPAGTPIGINKLSFEIFDNSGGTITVRYYQGATGNTITGTGISGGRKYVCQNSCIPIDSVVIISSYESGISNESQLFVLDSLLFYNEIANHRPGDISLSNNVVNENEPAGTIVGILTTTDADTADTHTYSFVTGTGDDDNSLFAILNDTLKTNGVFDFETKPAYTIRIQTEDNKGKTYSKAFSIAINDIDEDIDFTIDAIPDTFVDENTAYTGVTPSLSGDDPIGSVVYLISGTDAEDFTINPSTGVVSMVDRDYENPVDDNNDNVYELTITATDEDDNSDDESWTVTINNIYESNTICDIDKQVLNDSIAALQLQLSDSSLEIQSWKDSTNKYQTLWEGDTAIYIDTVYADTIVYNITVLDSTEYNIIVEDSIEYNITIEDSVKYNITVKDSIEYNIITQDSIEYNIVIQDSLEYNITIEDSTEYNIITLDSVEYNIIVQDSLEYNIQILDSTQYNIIFEDSIEYNIISLDSIEYNIITEDSIEYNITVQDSVKYNITIEDSVEYNIITQDSTEYNIIIEDSVEYNITVLDSTQYNITIEDSVEYNIITQDSTEYNIITLDSVEYNITIQDSVQFNIIMKDSIEYNTITVTIIEVDTLTTDIEESLTDLGITIAPNPTKEYLQITANNVIIKLSVFDISGNLVLEKEPMSNTADLHMHELIGTGTYILKIETNNQTVNVKAVFQ